MSYLTVDDLAARCEYAKRSGRGWQAKCPVHEDRSPSLSISEGNRATLIYCHDGCTLEELGEALGCTRQQLFYDYTENGRTSDSQVNLVLRQMIRDSEPYRRLTTLGDVMLRAFGQDDLAWEGFTMARWYHPDLADMEYKEAMTMHSIIRNSVLHTFLAPWRAANPQHTDWIVVRDAGMKRIQQTWRTDYV